MPQDESSETSEAGSGSGSGSSPGTLRAAAALIGLETLGLLAATVFFAVEIVIADADDRTRAVTATVLTLLGTVGLALVTRGLVRRRRWARAPGLVTNLLVLPVAYDLVRGGRWYVGGPLLVLALAVLVLLFVRSTDEALQE